MTQHPSLIIQDLGGNCPVQAEGTIMGQEFYFRARGSRWSFSVGGKDPVLNPRWRHEESYGKGFAAGWMSEEEAFSFILKAASLYIEAQQET